MNLNIPDKLYFKIGEVAKLADVPTHVLRYWETEFKEIKPKRASSKQRLYRREDVLLILKIKFLLHKQGYTIAGARKLLESGAPLPTEEPPVETEKPELTKALATLKNELMQLKQFINKKQ